MDTSDNVEPELSDEPRMASAARIYDYLLGGTHNFPVDREIADALQRAYPATQTGARWNRDFLRRVVRFMLDAGVDQFLDLGSGIPTIGNVHEIAQRENPDARVVYVDVERIAVAHSRAILHDNPNAVAVHADLRDPDRVLTDPDLCALLDFSRPVGILMLAVLHFVPGDPGDVVARYRDAAAPGSFLAISHSGGPVDLPAAAASAAEEAVGVLEERTTSPLASRSREEILGLFGDLRLVPPGLVLIRDWRPDAATPDGEDPTLPLSILGGVGRKE